MKPADRPPVTPTPLYTDSILEQCAWLKSQGFKGVWPNVPLGKIRLQFDAYGGVQMPKELGQLVHQRLTQTSNQPAIPAPIIETRRGSDYVWTFLVLDGGEGEHLPIELDLEAEEGGSFKELLRFYEVQVGDFGETIMLPTQRDDQLGDMRWVSKTGLTFRATLKDVLKAIYYVHYVRTKGQGRGA